MIKNLSERVYEIEMDDARNFGKFLGEFADYCSSKLRDEMEEFVDDFGHGMKITLDIDLDDVIQFDPDFSNDMRDKWSDKLHEIVISNYYGPHMRRTNNKHVKDYIEEFSSTFRDSVSFTKYVNVIVENKKRYPSINENCKRYIKNDVILYFYEYESKN